MKGELGARIVRPGLAELTSETLGRLVDGQLLPPVLAEGRALHADLGAYARRLRREGPKADAVEVPGLDRHLAMANLDVPVVVAAVVDAQAKGAIDHPDLATPRIGERRGPGQTGAILEGGVGDQIVGIDGEVAGDGGELTTLAAAGAPSALPDGNAGCNPEKPRQQPG